MKNHIRTIKFVDKLIGSALVRVLPARRFNARFNKGAPKRLLVIRPGGMGDAALLAPVLKMVKNRYPFLRMDILCEQRNAGIFQALSFVDTVLDYQKPRHMLALIKEYYDLIVDTEQSHFLSAVVCRFLKGGYTIGYKAEGRERMFHYAENYRHDIYEADMFLTLFRHSFDLPNKVTWEEPLFTPLGKAEQKIIRNICSQKEAIVCLFPGATISERLWPDERWAHVIDYIWETGCQPVLLGGSMEYDQCKRIQSFCKSAKVKNMCGMLSLHETAWLFKHSKLLISTDSGILHLGVICKLPTISLFGSGIKKKWAPKGEHHIAISLDLPCSPCTIYGHTPPCPKGKQCMMDIQIESVIESVKSLTVVPS